MRVSTGLCAVLLTFFVVCGNASIVPNDLVITPDECELAKGKEINGRCIVDPRNIPEAKPEPKATQVHPIDAIIVPRAPYNATGDNGFKPLTEVENYYVQSVCGIGEEPRTRIENGRIAQSNQFPWVMLRRCTAVLISSRHILTSAHCVYGNDTSVVPCSPVFEKDFVNQTAYYGGTCVNKDEFCPQGFDMKTTTVARVIYPRDNHEDCVVDNDIALILLNEDIIFDESVKPICISKLHPSNLVQLKDLGFGLVDDHNKSSELRYMTSKIIKIVSHDEVMTKGVDIGDGYPQARAGDSGGPLQGTFNGSSRTYLAGLQSRGTSDWTISSYVPAYADWICQLTGVCELD